MSGPQSLVLIRHFESFVNHLTRASRERDLTSDERSVLNLLPRDAHLSINGLVQLMRRCDQFREQKIHFSRILTSGYLRSDYSGRELLAGPIEVNPLLAERSFGVTHGMTSQELREYRERLGINREHQFDARDEGAESYEDVWKRQKPLFTKVLPGMADLESVALIVHSECVKVLRMRLEGMTIATFLRENAQGNLKMGNGDMIEYSRKDPCSNEIYPEYRYLRRWPLSEETFGPWEKIAP